MSSPPDRESSHHPFREKLSQAVGKVHDKIQDKLNPSYTDRDSDYSSRPSSHAPSSSYNPSSSAYPSHNSGRRVNPSSAQVAAYQSNRPAPNYSSSSYNRPENLPPRPPHYQRPAAASGSFQPRNNLHSSQQPSFEGKVGTIDLTDSPIGKKPEQPKFGETTPLKNNVPRTFDNKPARQPDWGKMMEPTRPGDKDAWRKKALGLTPGPVQATPARTPATIRPPVNPEYSSYVSRPAQPSFHNVPTNRPAPPTYGKSVPSAPRNVPWATNTAPKSYYENAEPIMGHVDPEKALKELLDNLGDPGVKRRSRKKKKKADKEGTPEDDEDKKDDLKQDVDELDDLASAMSGTKLEGPEKTDDEDEDEEEEEEDGEEEDLSHVDGLKVKLLPHQIDGLNFLLSREEGKNRGGILADDMGLGKTVQSIALILSHPNPRFPIQQGVTYATLSPDSKKAAKKTSKTLARGTLVVAPLALIKQWEAEINNKVESTHALKVWVHHGPKRLKDPKKLEVFDVVVTTYDVLRSEHQSSLEADGTMLHPVGVFGVKWWRIVCDEAHTIKNRLAKQSKAVCALQSRYRWALTGTPIQNTIDDLQSLIIYLRIAPLDNIAEWKAQITTPMQRNKDGLAIQRVAVILKAIMLRRTKDVLKLTAGNKMELPNRNVTAKMEKFSPKEQRFYEKLESRTEENLQKLVDQAQGKQVNMTSALVLLLRLRQACNHPHLLLGKIPSDPDSGIGLATPHKPKSAKPNKKANDFEDDDLLAGLMGGLGLDQGVCDICQTKLTREERDDGETRCSSCTADLEDIGESPKKEKKSKEHKPLKSAKSSTSRPKPRGRNVIFDSDDEEDDDVNDSHDFLDDEAEESDTPETPVRKAPLGGPAEIFDDDTDSDSAAEDVFSSLDHGKQRLTYSTKISHLMNILRQELKAGNKTIVFSQFTQMLNLIEPFLRSEGIKFARYDGSMKNDQREDSLARIRGDGLYAPKLDYDGKTDRNFHGVLLCSLKCGALGLNLTAACRVVILEPFWNPFVEEQAIDRVHRFGQTKDVEVYKLTIEGSVEERILKLQEQKRELAKAAMGDGVLGDKKKASKLNINEILALFRKDAEEGARESRVGKGLGERTKILKETRPVGDYGSSRDRYGGYGDEIDGMGGEYRVRRPGERRNEGRDVSPRARERGNVFGRR